MALLFIDSFDHYDTAHVLSKWTTNFTQSSIATGVGRCGTNCMNLGTFNGLTKGIPFGSTTGTIGFAANVVAHGTLTNAEIHLSQLWGSSPNGAHLTLWYHAMDGSLSVVRSGASGEIGRTVPDVIRQDNWYFIEWQAVIHLTAGSVVVRINNVVVLTLTGINTVGDSGGVPYPVDLRAVAFSCGSNEQWMLDDVYVLDSTGPAPQNTFLGDVHIECLRPVMAGTRQEWNLVGPSHWEAVDDAATPDDDATYLSTTTLNALDTQRYMGTGLSAGTIFGVQLNLHARKTDSGVRTVAPVVRHAGTEYVGAPQAPSATDYHYLIQTYNTNPGTGAAWTIADVNAAEYGVKLTE